MKSAFDRYLDRIMAVADIRDPARELQIREELRDHLEQKLKKLESQGLDRSEALVKAIEDHGNPVLIGYRLRPWRFIDVRLRGTARGFIAIGPKARGVVALGGVAVGVIAMGGVAVGVVSFGGLALALLLACGGLATGGIAYGGVAAGVIAFGGLAVGGIAAGGAAAGLWVPGAGQALWSYFNWHTVPAWLRGIGEFLSFNPNSRADREAFSSLIVVLVIATVLIQGITVSIQTISMMKEGKRIREIDPSNAG